MAADGYLKAAAAQLHSAAQALKQEIDQMHSDMMITQNQLKHDIDNNEAEIRVLVGRQASDNEKEAAGLLTFQMGQKKTENDSKKQQLNETLTRTNQAMQAKQNAMNDILNDARNLENKAGNPAYH